MQGNKVTIKEIVAAVDPAAGHAMPWLKDDVAIRAVTIREFLRLLLDHPSLTELVHSTKPRETADQMIEVLGLDAMAALAAVGMTTTANSLLRLGREAVAHAFVSIAEITFVLRDVDDFFEEERKKGTTKPRRPQPGMAAEEVPRDSGLLTLVRDASEYTVRTGRDGFDLSPIALAFARRASAEVDQRNRLLIADAISAATGDKEAAARLGEIY